MYPIFRIWKETGTSLVEIKEKWSYEEVMEANAILDMNNATDLAGQMFTLTESENSMRNR